MNEQKPSVGRIVHYVSYGTPVRDDGTQAFASQCRAAIVTEVPWPDDDEVGDAVKLAVFNPTGMFLSPEAYPHIEPDADAPLQGGTWHWPERT